MQMEYKYLHKHKRSANTKKKKETETSRPATPTFPEGFTSDMATLHIYIFFRAQIFSWRNHKLNECRRYGKCVRAA